MKKYTYCIWDYNGTILDDVELGIDTINELMRIHGIGRELDRKSYRECFGFPVINYYRALGFDFDKTPYDEIANEWVDIYLSNFDKAKIFDDAVPTLEFFKARGVKQSVLSASERNLLVSQINGLGIADYFEELMGIDNIYGASKLMLAKSWRERHSNEKVLFIGDTLHDIETAKLLCADCFIVCAGHQSREIFKDCDATVVSSLTELCEVISAL